ncbi:methionine--tRNA ligase [Candidatus Uhrbacteria bacterium]|nr:methionine--tRNA ligase [Candidatus Uhrbacteria bacterium]
MEKFYLTTPIYYVNDAPHIGHAYTTIVADVLARYWRMRGADVFFLTGTDENSQKNVEAAARAGEKDMQKYLDRMSALWQQTFDSLAITHTDFIRTTEERHTRGVAMFWKRVWDAGDIYSGTYEGWYCVGCEAFVTESDLVDGRCTIHQRPAERLQEKNYFFRLSKYRDALLNHIETHPDFVQPESRRNEIKSYIKDFMEDVSISRQSVKWGIPVPGDPSQIIYVWFDALVNYLTGVGFGADEAAFNREWPADLHLVGKDIIKFHCALWPAMLMSAKLPLPHRVFAHGFFTINGEKMSKSLGNFVDPLAVVKDYDLDTLRYYLLRDIPFGEDGDFSTERLQQRYESELANGLGNLVYRVLSMTEKYCDGVVPPRATGRAEFWGAYDRAMEELRPHDAIAALWGVVRESNRFIDEEEPWKLATTHPDRLRDVLYILLENLRHIAWMLVPLMPETSLRIFASLGLHDTMQLSHEQATQWGGLSPGMKTLKGTPLFPKRQ